MQIGVDSSSDCSSNSNDENPRQKRPKASSQLKVHTQVTNGSSKNRRNSDLQFSNNNQAPTLSLPADSVKSNQNATTLSRLAKLHDDEALPINFDLNGGQASLQHDIKLGWRPANPYSGAPIPLYYDFDDTDPVDYYSNDIHKVPIYLGPRFADSAKVHKEYSKRDLGNGQKSYNFRFPPRTLNIKRSRVEEPRIFTGMNPNLKQIYAKKNQEYDQAKELTWDSDFESGNLDIVQRTSRGNYNLYMRVDTNTKGHHQWFNFSVEFGPELKYRKVTFHIMNFTKDDALFAKKGSSIPGMRIVVAKRSSNYKLERAGENLRYYKSELIRKINPLDPTRHKYYNKLSFEYEFTSESDKIFFSYNYPYTFTNLQSFLRDLTVPDPSSKQIEGPDHFGQGVLCKSLSGVDVPLLTITSRIKSDPTEWNLVKLQEFEDTQDSKLSIPLYKRKKYVVITGRVHPGESNSSWMMQGFIRALMSGSMQARALRKRIVFKIVPMMNVDGVIIGNYRTSMSGNDLNRKFHAPDSRVHPEVSAVKDLIADIVYGKPKVMSPDDWNQVVEPETIEEDVLAYIDMHGHSRKKNVFIYGPQYSLSSEGYYRSRMIPKLLSEETSKFRYHSCQFKYEHCKRKTSRIVLNQEFDITNCYTLEASFHAHFDEQRENYEFTEKSYEEMGEHLVNSLYEYTLIVEEEDRQKQLKVLEKKKRKRQIQAINELKEKITSKQRNVNANLERTRASQESTRMNNQYQTHAGAVTTSNEDKLKKSPTKKFSNNSRIVSFSDNKDVQRRTIQQEELKEEGYLTNSTFAGPEESINKKEHSKSKSPAAIRTMADLFKQVDAEEEKRGEMAQIEELELGFKPDQDEPQASNVLFDETAIKKEGKGKNKNIQKSFDSDDANSDASDEEAGELVGDLKAALFGELISTINEFSRCYGGNTAYLAQEKKAAQKQKAREKQIKESKLRKQKTILQSQTQIISPSKAQSYRMNGISKIQRKDDKEPRSQNTQQKPKEKSMADRHRSTINSTRGLKQFPTAVTHFPSPRQTIYRTANEDINPQKEQSSLNKGIIGQQSTTVIQFKGVKASVPSYKVEQKPAESAEITKERIADRQRQAQQGMLNRIGMKVQALKNVPLRQFLEAKYHQRDPNQFGPIVLHENSSQMNVQHGNFQGLNTQGIAASQQNKLSPLVVNCLKTGQDGEIYMDETRNKPPQVIVNVQNQHKKNSQSYGGGETILIGSSKSTSQNKRSPDKYRHKERKLVVPENDEVRYKVEGESQMAMFQKQPPMIMTNSTTTQQNSINNSANFYDSKIVEQPRQIQLSKQITPIQQVTPKSPAPVTENIIESFQMTQYVQSQSMLKPQRKNMGRTSMKFQKVIDQANLGQTSKALLSNIFEPQQSNFLTGQKIISHLPNSVRSPNQHVQYVQNQSNQNNPVNNNTSLPDIQQIPRELFSSFQKDNREQLLESPKKKVLISSPKKNRKSKTKKKRQEDDIDISAMAFKVMVNDNEFTQQDDTDAITLGEQQPQEWAQKVQEPIQIIKEQKPYELADKPQMRFKKDGHPSELMINEQSFSRSPAKKKKQGPGRKTPQEGFSENLLLIDDKQVLPQMREQSYFNPEAYIQNSSFKQAMTWDPAESQSRSIGQDSRLVRKQAKQDQGYFTHQVNSDQKKLSQNMANFSNLSKSYQKLLLNQSNQNNNFNFAPEMQVQNTSNFNNNEKNKRR